MLRSVKLGSTPRHHCFNGMKASQYRMISTSIAGDFLDRLNIHRQNINFSIAGETSLPTALWDLTASSNATVTLPLAQKWRVNHDSQSPCSQTPSSCY